MSNIAELRAGIAHDLLDRRNREGLWTGRLSSSAVSTATACCALHLAGGVEHLPLVVKAQDFLCENMNADGGWGDTPESPSNITATILGYAALKSSSSPDTIQGREAAERFLTKRFGGITPEHIVRGILDAYGNDMTFSAPILALCAAIGIIPWKNVPRLPFELALLPAGFYRFLNLPVVSYAIPALIAVGLGKSKHSIFEELCIRKMSSIQPEDGGYLEAVPLTSFCVVCLTAAGKKECSVVRKGLRFIASTVREDGSWPIDTNLEQWLSSLTVKALGREAFSGKERSKMSSLILSRQYKIRHPFNGAAPGGWGWSPLSGAVPDADDTSAALAALYELGETPCTEDIEKGLFWLMGLQNSDGGIATFCRGWGKLPFDRSCPDISAHAYRAFKLWSTTAPRPLRKKMLRAKRRIRHYLKSTLSEEGYWLPLWFGDQDAPDQHAPVYGTAVVLEHLAGCEECAAFTGKAISWLCDAQNQDGGWSGAPGVKSKIIMTARAVSALKHYRQASENVRLGQAFLLKNAEKIDKPEPVGLYFAKLWYSEELYSRIFVLDALREMK